MAIENILLSLGSNFLHGLRREQNSSRYKPIQENLADQKLSIESNNYKSSPKNQIYNGSQRSPLVIYR